MKRETKPIDFLYRVLKSSVTLSQNVQKINKIQEACERPFSHYKIRYFICKCILNYFADLGLRYAQRNLKAKLSHGVIYSRKDSTHRAISYV